MFTAFVSCFGFPYGLNSVSLEACKLKCDQAAQVSARVVHVENCLGDEKQYTTFAPMEYNFPIVNGLDAHITHMRWSMAPGEH